MYKKYSEDQGWNCRVIDDLTLEIKGKNAYNNLRYETGVHRVQRIPETEKLGRVHTSTASVAILPIRKKVKNGKKADSRSPSSLDLFKKNWEKINIYENIGDNIYLLNYNDTIYVIYKYDKYYNLSELNKITYMYDLYQKANIILESNNLKKISLIHNKYNKVLYFKNNINYEEINEYNINRIYFSCIDELIFDLEKISSSNENKKKLQ